jgi:hypothetical protein
VKSTTASPAAEEHRTGASRTPTSRDVSSSADAAMIGLDREMGHLEAISSGIWIFGRRGPPAAAVRCGTASFGGSGGRGRWEGGHWRWRHGRPEVEAATVSLSHSLLFHLHHPSISSK